MALLQEKQAVCLFYWGALVVQMYCLKISGVTGEKERREWNIKVRRQSEGRQREKKSEREQEQQRGEE